MTENYPFDTQWCPFSFSCGLSDISKMQAEAVHEDEFRVVRILFKMYYYVRVHLNGTFYQQSMKISTMKP